MSNISLHTFTLGDVPPRVHGVKVRFVSGACFGTVAQCEGLHPGDQPLLSQEVREMLGRVHAARHCSLA